MTDVKKIIHDNLSVTNEYCDNISKFKRIIISNNVTLLSRELCELKLKINQMNSLNSLKQIGTQKLYEDICTVISHIEKKALHIAKKYIHLLTSSPSAYANVCIYLAYHKCGIIIFSKDDFMNEYLSDTIKNDTDEENENDEFIEINCNILDKVGYKKYLHFKTHPLNLIYKMSK